MGMLTDDEGVEWYLLTFSRILEKGRVGGFHSFRPLFIDIEELRESIVHRRSRREQPWQGAPTMVFLSGSPPNSAVSPPARGGRSRRQQERTEVKAYLLKRPRESACRRSATRRPGAVRQRLGDHIRGIRREWRESRTGSMYRVCHYMRVF